MRLISNSRLLLQQLNLVSLTDFTYKYQPGWWWFCFHSVWSVCLLTW